MLTLQQFNPDILLIHPQYTSKLEYIFNLPHLNSILPQTFPHLKKLQLSLTSFFHPTYNRKEG